MRVRMDAWSRVAGSAAMIAALSIAALAQTPADHTVHHPNEPKSAPPATAPKSAPVPGTATMGASGMEHMTAVEKRQLFPSLIAMPPASDAERQRLAAEAHARMSRGLPLLDGAGDEAMRYFSTRDYEGLRAAAARAREGLDLLDSGVSTHLALAAGRDGSAIALDWFKSQMALSPPQGNAGDLTRSVSPGHLTAMLVLTLLTGGLLALQVARHRRLRAILAAGQPTTSTPAPPAARLTVVPPAQRPNRQLPADDVVPSREVPAPRAWSGELKIAQIIRETPSIKTFRLVDPSGTVLPFDYLPGQFMQVEIEAAEGGPLRRAYTLASSPTRKAYAELTIKREAKGQVSQHLHDHVAVGDALKVSAPYGHFTFTGMDEDAIVLIGGGVGVTPLMSVVRYLTDLAWPGQIFFVYAARSTEEFAFRAELEYLQQRHRNLQVLATMLRSEGTTWMGPQGQITRELLLAAVPELARRRVHLCGPPPMMATVKELLLELGVAADRIHTESFGPPSRPADVLPPSPPAPVTAARIATTLPAAAPEAPARAPPIAAASVVFARSGKSAPLLDGMTVLEAAEAVGVDIPWSCRIGISGTCKVRLLEGEVSMEVQDGLAPSDKAAGYILACQAKTKGGNLVVEA